MPLSNPLGFKHHPLEGPGMYIVLCISIRLIATELSEMLFLTVSEKNITIKCMDLPLLPEVYRYKYTTRKGSMAGAILPLVLVKIMAPYYLINPPSGSSAIYKLNTVYM